MRRAAAGDAVASRVGHEPMGPVAGRFGVAQPKRAVIGMRLAHQASLALLAATAQSEAPRCCLRSSSTPGRDIACSQIGRRLFDVLDPP